MRGPGGRLLCALGLTVGCALTPCGCRSRLADVRLNSDMSLGELKRALQLTPRVGSSAVRNRCVAEFGDEYPLLAQAAFYDPDDRCQLTDGSHFYELTVNSPFRGSLMGVRLDTPENEVLRILERNHPQAHATEDGDIAGFIVDAEGTSN